MVWTHYHLDGMVGGEDGYFHRGHPFYGRFCEAHTSLTPQFAVRPAANGVLYATAVTTRAKNLTQVQGRNERNERRGD
jgi:hypothetical protein